MASLTIRTRSGDGNPAPRNPAVFGRTLRSELTKIRSVRSTYWSMAMLVAVSLAWCIAFCAGEASRWAHLSAQDRAGFDPTQASIVGVALLGQLVIAVLGALVATLLMSRRFGYRLLAGGFVDALRCIPFLLFAYIVYYGFPSLAHRTIDENATNGVAREIETALRDFEPRLVAGSIRARHSKKSSLVARMSLLAGAACESRATALSPLSGMKAAI